MSEPTRLCRDCRWAKRRIIRFPDTPQWQCTHDKSSAKMTNVVTGKLTISYLSCFEARVGVSSNCGYTGELWEPKDRGWRIVWALGK